MFRELYDVAKHTPLTIIVTPRGEQLSVIVIPKPDEDDNKALSKPIQATGTPEDLDNELPAALASYCANINDLRTRIDLPTAAIDEAKAKAEKKAKKAAPAASTPTPSKKARTRKAVAPKVKKAPAKKAAPKKSKPPKVPKIPKAPASARKKAAPMAAKRGHQEGKPGKDKCLEDVRAVAAALNVEVKDLGRRQYLKAKTKQPNKTGRRYEKLWKNWEEMLAELLGQVTTGKSAERSKEVKAFVGAAKAREAAAPAETRTTADPAGNWPFPVKTDPPMRQVRTSTGAHLASTTVEYKVGDKYASAHNGDFTIVEVRDDRYIVMRPEDAGSPPPQATSNGSLL